MLLFLQDYHTQHPLKRLQLENLLISLVNKVKGKNLTLRETDSRFQRMFRGKTEHPSLRKKYNRLEPCLSPIKCATFSPIKSLYLWAAYCFSPIVNQAQTFYRLTNFITKTI